VKSLWSFRWLRPWLFRRWESRRRSELEASPSARRPLAVGDESPAFELPDDAGRLRRSDEWIGRGDAVVWLTNLCAVCADQARELARADLTVPIVAIHHPDGASSPPSEFRRRTGADFPVLIDDGSVGRAWAGATAPGT
jgi:hypothetical protein